MLLALAPMDGITDCVYRIICKEIFDKYNQNDDFLMVTEFMSSDGYIANPAWVVKHLMHTEIEVPLIAQIFGADKKILLQTAKDIQDKYDFAWVELNVWCPSSKIMKIGGGSALMKDRARTIDLIKELRNNLNMQFSIKTRVWLNDADKEEQFQFLLDASKYCNIIALHGRTLNQWHSWEVDWEYIYKFKKECNQSCKVIGNGWVKTYQEAVDNYWNLDGVMIGQASMWNPWIFTNNEPSLQEKFEIMIKHLQLLTAQEIYFHSWVFNNWILTMPTIKDFETIISDYENTNIKLDFELRSPIEFRKHIFSYIKWLSWSKQFKQGIVWIRGYIELKRYIEEYFLSFEE